MTGDHAEKSDAMAQLARLREQVEILMREKVSPMVSDANDTVHAAAHDASEAVRAGTSSMAASIREQPIAAVLIGMAVGWLLGRTMR